MKINRHIAIAAACGMAAVPAGSALGKNGGNDRVQRSGSCSQASHFKLKVKPDDGRLEVEFEVDQNRNGVTWDVVVRRNGAVVASGRRTTKAPSGSFSFERKVSGASGDKITARATRGGESCQGSVTAP
jgi:hypothetical protein